MMQETERVGATVRKTVPSDGPPSYDRPNLVAQAKWVRAFLGGVAVADSRRAFLLYGHRELPVPEYAFPLDDVRRDLLTEGPREAHPRLGEVRRFDVAAGAREARGAAFTALEPPRGCEALAEAVVFDWDAMDRWMVEDEEARVHAHDPWHRIDMHRSTRRVEVVLEGEVVARSARPVLLFETRLPVRYYLPRSDVRLDRLAPSDTVTRCAYKGEARHFHFHLRGDDGRIVAEDVAWTYPFPNPAYGKVQDLVAFYQERVEALHVDGAPEERPKTMWSRDPPGRTGAAASARPT